jgi:predicted DNA-binding protein with PD1-like motif
MKAIEGRLGRVFVLRLNHDDPLPKSIEDFAAEKQIELAQVVFIGGIYNGNLVAGPRATAEPRPEPIVLPVNEASDAVATGIIARSESGRPALHMHGALGRSGQTMAGCFQKGVSVWLVGEAVIYEILGGSNARRILDKKANLTLFEILDEDRINS